ncbi:MAG: hypothetical protein AAF909_06145 [Pseudomonadota bacterium]
MTALSLLLIIKIVVTLLTVALPFLLLKKQWLDRIAGFGHVDVALYRLYGVALLALLVAYTSGIWLIEHQGSFPWGVVAMGLVSNTGAFLTLCLTGRLRTSPALTIFFGLIALGLGASAIQPGSALTAVW